MKVKPEAASHFLALATGIAVQLMVEVLLARTLTDYYKEDSMPRISRPWTFVRLLI